MRILLIHQFYLEKDDGGGSRFNEMTKAWEASGHSITVLAGMMHYYGTGEKKLKYKGKYTFIDKYSENISVVRSHVSESINSNFLGRIWAYFSFVFSSIYAGMFKVKGKHDIILVTSPPLFVGITALVLSFLKRTPFVFEVRDLWPESAIDTGVLKNKIIIKLAYWFEALIYKKAKLINVLTPAFREKLITNKKVNPQKIIFIPNAADFSLSDDLLNNFDIEKFKIENGLSNKFIITYVGAHGVANHLIQVVEAAEKLVHVPEILFLLIGDGMQKKMLIEEVEKRKLENVRFINSVPKAEVFKYILASSLGASILKKVDTFKTVYSNKTFDYMACKKPILMLIDGVSRELIETAQCGTYVEPENIDSFVDCIKNYFLNGKERIEIEGNNGYQYAKINYDRKYLADNYLSYLQNVKRK